MRTEGVTRKEVLSRSPFPAVKPANPRSAAFSFAWFATTIREANSPFGASISWRAWEANFAVKTLKSLGVFCGLDLLLRRQPRWASPCPIRARRNSSSLHELGHHHLVHGRVRVSHAAGDVFAGLLPEPHGMVGVASLEFLTCRTWDTC